jgi:hypothetical protein
VNRGARHGRWTAAVLLLCAAAVGCGIRPTSVPVDAGAPASRTACPSRLPSGAAARNPADRANQPLPDGRFAPLAAERQPAAGGLSSPPAAAAAGAEPTAAGPAPSDEDPNNEDPNNEDPNNEIPRAMPSCLQTQG